MEETYKCGRKGGFSAKWNPCATPEVLAEMWVLTSY
ncbi:MAG: hypothetical protein H6Q05_3555 [Acidobacteria bacterium]|jgi:hypothetical protein|nr:hypothetical protein [Acidobacteriota bacterium]